MTPDKKSFFSMVAINENVVADNKKLRVEEKGSVTISALVNDKICEIVVKDVFYVPELKINLLSVRKTSERCYTIKFNEHNCKIENADDDLVTIAKSINNIYKLQPNNVGYNCKIDDSLMWHRRLGHLNRINMKLLREKLARGLRFNDPDERPCEVCVKGQANKTANKEK